MSYWYEVIFVILAWAVQIGIALLIAFLLGCLIHWAEQKFRRKTLKRLPRCLIALLLVCIILAGFTLRPPVLCEGKLAERLQPEWREEVRSVSSGLYSRNIPLVPLCVHITDVDNFVAEGAMEYSIAFDVYYFCAGRMGMEYSTRDGFNISDPIFRS